MARGSPRRGCPSPQRHRRRYAQRIVGGSGAPQRCKRHEKWRRGSSWCAEMAAAAGQKSAAVSSSMPCSSSPSPWMLWLLLAQLTCWYRSKVFECLRMQSIQHWLRVSSGGELIDTLTGSGASTRRLPASLQNWIGLLLLLPQSRHRASAGGYER